MQFHAKVFILGLSTLVLHGVAASTNEHSRPRPARPHRLQRPHPVQDKLPQALCERSSTETTIAQLRAELSAATAARGRLRAHLLEVGHEAHLSIARLREKVQKAEAAAERTEGQLRQRFAEASEQLKQEKAKERSLEVELERRREDGRSEAEEAATKAAAASRAAAKEAALLRGRLEAADHSQQQLRVQIEGLQRKTQREAAELSANATQMSHLKAQLTLALAAAADAEKHLKTEVQAYRALEANMTQGAAAALAASKAARHERMGLLEQISELQEEAQQAQKRTALAEGRAQDAQQDAVKQAEEEKAAVQRANQEQRHMAVSWKEKLEASRAEAAAAEAKSAGFAKQLAALAEQTATKDKQLHAAALEVRDLRDARDAAARAKVSFQQLDTKVEVSLQQEREAVASVKARLREAEARATASTKELSGLRQKEHSLEAQLEVLNKSRNDMKAEADKRVHSTMLSAAAKVRELEDQREGLNEELKKVKDSLASAGAESARAKDTLVQETDAALKASQRAESLSASLAASEKDVQQTNSRAESLSTKVSELQAARDHAVSALQKSAAQETQWHSRADTLGEALHRAKAQVQQLTVEDKHLREQVEMLSSEGQRADDLASSLQHLRDHAKQEDSQKVQLQEQMERLRDLKDRYSTDYETLRNESDTWRNKAQDLDTQLQAAQRRNEALAHQKEVALDHVRAARSQEDEYFEENSQLQLQNEALAEKLKEANLQLNRTVVTEQKLQVEADDLRAEEHREQQNSHAAWVANEQELVQARRETQMASVLKNTAQAELERTRAVLTDKQRQRLGLTTSTGTAKGHGTEMVAVTKAELERTRAVVTDRQRQHLGLTTSTGTAKGHSPEVVAMTKATVDKSPALRSVGPSKPRSALQRLAEYFASPLQR